jgi:hypothetical protein
VFTYFLGPRPSIKLPPDAFLSVYNGVYVPWNGDTGRLMVNRPMLGKTTTITVNNQTVVSVPKVTLQDPWIETVLPEAEPKQLVVVQVQPAPQRFGILVFVDGSCLQGGGSLDDWRAKKPAPKDRFEQALRPEAAWGMRTAVFIGVLSVLPASGLVVAHAPTDRIIWLFLAAGFLVMAGLWLLVGLFVRWLQTKRTWPWRLRALLVPTVPIVLIVLVVLTIQALTEAK